MYYSATNPCFYTWLNKKARIEIPAVAKRFIIDAV